MPSAILAGACLLGDLYADGLSTEHTEWAKVDPAELPTFDPAAAANYVLIEGSKSGRGSRFNGGNHLYDFASGKIVVEYFSRNRGARLIKDDNRRMFVAPSDDERRRKAFGRGIAAVFKDKTLGTVYVAADRRRACWIQDGDYWRGEFNWEAMQIEKREKVTDLQTFEGKDPILWSGNHVFLDGKFDKAKPIVRINLFDGEIEELDWFNVLQGNGQVATVLPYFINPSRTIGVSVMGEIIRLIDLNDGRTVDLGNTYLSVDRFGTPRKLTKRRIFDDQNRATWLDDATLTSTVFQVGSEREVGFILDLRKGEIRPVKGEPFTENGKNFIPYRDVNYWRLANAVRDHSGDPAIGYFAYTALRENLSPDDDFKRAALIDFKEEKVVILPEAKIGFLISRDTYLYDIQGQGLSKNGLWAWSRGSGKTTRLSTKTRYLHDLIHLPALNSIVFQDPNEPICRIKLDGSGKSELDPEKFLELEGPVNTEAVDLGWGESALPAWRKLELESPLTTEEVASEVPRIALMKALEGEPDEVKGCALRALQSAQSNYSLSKFYHPVPTALAILEVAKEKKSYDGHINGLISDSDLREARNPEGMKQYAYARAMEVIKNDKMPAQTKEKISRRVGAEVAAFFMEHDAKVIGIREVDGAFSKSLRKAMSEK